MVSVPHEVLVEAQRFPELGLLSALAHGREEGGLEVVMAALRAIAGLDDEHAALYYDVLIASLSEGLRQELKAMVLKGKYEYQSEFARKYFEQGRDEGRDEGRHLALQAAIVQVLEARQLLTEEARAKIDGQADGAALELWLKRAAIATSLEDVFL